MNLNESKAIIFYGDSTFKVIEHGTYVLCHVSDKKIPLSELKYWSVERQEAYWDAEHSFKRDLEVNRD
jgi:hypothetical protein